MDNFANGTGGVLIGTYTTSAGYQHAVIITKMNNDGTFNYYDPQNNSSNTRNVKQLTHYLALTRNCP
ncbi:hypothetical protein AB674_17620 [Flavobacterium sp. ABG]|nr:hypothetical protein AB674_17620 [Flavobacterium sp. ABG]